jgi:hypothetical protein
MIAWPRFRRTESSIKLMGGGALVLRVDRSVPELHRGCFDIDYRLQAGELLEHLVIRGA